MRREGCPARHGWARPLTIRRTSGGNPQSAPAESRSSRTESWRRFRLQSDTVDRDHGIKVLLAGLGRRVEVAHLRERLRRRVVIRHALIQRPAKSPDRILWDLRQLLPIAKQEEA